MGSTTVKCAVVERESGKVVFSDYRRHDSAVKKTLLDILCQISEKFPNEEFIAVFTGSQSSGFAEKLGVAHIQEVIACSIAIGKYYPKVLTSIELGGQDAKILFFSQENGETSVLDMRMNGVCAGGTGAFIDQMASLLNIKPEEFNELASAGKKVYDISGRCGVFAKTDIQPLMNQGVPREDIALSCLHALAKQTIGGLAQGMEMKTPILFAGGPFFFIPKLIDVFCERLGIEKNKETPVKNYRYKLHLQENHYKKLFKETTIILENKIGKNIINKSDGTIALITKSKIKKMISGKAIKKSIDTLVHFEAAKNIDVLFEKSLLVIRHPDRDGDINIKDISVYKTEFDFENFLYPIKITLKSYVNELKENIYSVEAIDIEKIGDTENFSVPSYETGSASCCPNLSDKNIINVFEKCKGFEEKSEKKYIIPENAQILIAMGAALSLDTALGNKKQNPMAIEKMLEVFSGEMTENFTDESEKTVKFFENEEEFAKFNERYKIDEFVPKEFEKGEKIGVFIGIDAGSTTTKFVAIDENKEVIYSFYKNNLGKPIETAKQGLLEFENYYKTRGVEIEVKGLGTTGYGEILFAKAFGADFHIVETIAHKAAAHFYEPNVSFILDLGGQDMKAIFINNGIITNIALNEACSAGCGSFIESYSKSLKIAPQDIAKLAFEAKNPSALGSRCTVFMNSSIITEQKSGKSVGDILAGLCRSVVENLFTKVVRISNPSVLGEHIVVQGGTFKNDAVLRAFTQYIGKEVIRPRFAGEMGALGVALLTKEHLEQ